MSSLNWLLEGKKANEELLDVLEEGEGEEFADGEEEEIIEELISQLSDEELAALTEEILEEVGGADVGEQEVLAHAEENVEEVAEKLAAASEFLGKVMSHSFYDELGKLVGREQEKQAQKYEKKSAQEKSAESRLTQAIAVIRSNQNE